MKIFIDTNIFLDLLFKRVHYHEAVRILNLCEAGIFEGIIADITLLNIDYVASKQMHDIKKFLNVLNETLKVVGADNHLFRLALQYGHTDLEDVIQCLCAQKVLCQTIVTNDKKFYAKCDQEILSSTQFLEKYDNID